MSFQHCFYLVDGRWVFLLKNLIGNDSREHVAGDVPGGSGDGHQPNHNGQNDNECRHQDVLFSAVGVYYLMSTRQQEAIREERTASNVTVNGNQSIWTSNEESDSTRHLVREQSVGGSR